VRQNGRHLSQNRRGGTSLSTSIPVPFFISSRCLQSASDIYLPINISNIIADNLSSGTGLIRIPSPDQLVMANLHPLSLSWVAPSLPIQRISAYDASFADVINFADILSVADIYRILLHFSEILSYICRSRSFSRK